MKSDEAMLKLCEAMRSEFCAGPEFELALGDLVGQYRKVHDRRMRDARAADLLAKEGRTVAASRLGVRENTVYKMTHRHRARFLTVKQQA